ncbi:MAG: M50 family metallopeptidase [Deltaproteobacteria bacterium]|nr:M50 family metallopeptidase [Deltaproteobacteria bacterium]
MASPQDAATPRFDLVLAAIAALALEHLVPFGRLVLYPLTLLATWVHEMGHGLTAVLVGGRFDTLQIFGDASGVALAAAPLGIRSALVSAGGLVGPPIAGATMLLFARGQRRAAIALGGLALAIAISLGVWVRTLVGWIALAPVAAVLGLVAWKWRGGRVWVAQFLAVCFGLDTLSRIDYLFESSAVIGGEMRASDVANIASSLFPPAILWGVLIAALDLVLLGGAFYLAFRTPKRIAEPVTLA